MHGGLFLLLCPTHEADLFLHDPLRRLVVDPHGLLHLLDAPDVRVRPKTAQMFEEQRGRSPRSMSAQRKNC